MPAIRNDKDRRGVYIHTPTVTSKASTGTKSGRVRTVFSRHEQATPESSGSRPEENNTTVDTDNFQEYDLYEMTLNNDLTPENISGITVTIPAKRYTNLVGC